MIDSPNMGPRTKTTRRERSGAMAARQQRDQSAIQGLHCLTDRSSHDETTFRLKALKENWNDPVYSGLALHPFGGSFSHRKIGNEKEMYGSHHGHALDFHKPDYVPDRPRLYLDYAKTLYDTLCALTGGNKAPFSVALEYPLTRVIQAGCGFNGADAEAQCLKEMKTTLMCRIGFDPSYAPEDFVGKYWRDFASQHSDFLSRREIGGAASVRAKIEMAGRTWRERRAKVPALSVAL